MNNQSEGAKRQEHGAPLSNSENSMESQVNEIQEKEMGQHQKKVRNIKVQLWSKSGSKLIVISVVVLGLFLIIHGVKNKLSFENEQYIEFPKNAEELRHFLENHSNFNKVIKESNDFWPEEYFEINLKDKKISYWKNNEKKEEVEYKKNGTNNNLKTFKDEEEREKFKGFPQIDNWEELVEKEYMEAIVSAQLEEDVKRLCILYNALAGHPQSYIVFGKEIGHSNWVYQTADLFPSYCIPLTLKENSVGYNDLKEYIDESNAGHESTIKLSDLIKKIMRDISVKAISFDYRKEMIRCGEDSVEATQNKIPQLKAPYVYEKLNGKSASGWVVPIDDSTNIIRASDYYKHDDNRIIIDKENYDRIEGLKWNDREKESIWYTFEIILGCIIIGLFAIYLIIKPLIKSRHLKLKKKEKKTIQANQYPEKTSSQIENQNQSKLAEISKEETTISTLPPRNLTIEILELEKQLKEEKEKAEKEIKLLKENAENNLKKLRETINSLRNQQKDYNTLKQKANQWDKLTNCTQEKEVISILEGIKEKFPKINTIKDIYLKAQQEVPEDRNEQMIRIFEALDKQLKNPSGLVESYQRTVKNANYAITVGDIHEHCKRIVEKYSSVKAYQRIVKQDRLSIWDRLIIMIWAMECTNEIFNAFHLDSFNDNTIKATKEIHQDDVMQIYATRIFFNQIDKDEAQQPQSLKDLREKKMEERKSTLKEDNINLTETEEYKNIVNRLDTIFEQKIFISKMNDRFMTKFSNKELMIKDKGNYLSLLIAMGLHMSDYIRFSKGVGLVYCPNTQWLLSGKLPNNYEFRYNDPEFSGEFLNRVYTWLKESGIQHLEALVDGKLILPNTEE
jgi:hypothetical protein